MNHQNTYLDSLGKKLRENRVKNIIEPILAKQTLPDTLADNCQYLIDLGLLPRDPMEGMNG
ncbi:hypothetical protein [Cuspidothrix issatschenkoi]|uniref:hypothetical protein n=1 Tax=Cuspidothrix issatschenkoi TaxID=230752 RepID=UPI001D157E6A|nr:hypothetical protein [Cuspidothrix issatschenkoi]